LAIVSFGFVALWVLEWFALVYRTKAVREILRVVHRGEEILGIARELPQIEFLGHPVERRDTGGANSNPVSYRLNTSGVSNMRGDQVRFFRGNVSIA
jgi:hypothetical protein